MVLCLPRIKRLVTLQTHKRPTWTHPRASSRLHVCTHIHVCMCAYTSRHACARAYIHVYICLMCVCVFIHTHTLSLSLSHSHKICVSVCVRERERERERESVIHTLLFGYLCISVINSNQDIAFDRLLERSPAFIRTFERPPLPPLIIGQRWCGFLAGK